MKIEIHENNLILSEMADFLPDQIFDCGQCFRWNSDGEGWTGVAFGRALTVKRLPGESVIFYDLTLNEFESRWRRYFDLDRDYGTVKRVLMQDETMRDAIHFGGGIRILRQELWETVVSFIVSAGNNIPRIKKIIEALCINFGTKFNYMGKNYYSFPDPERLAGLSREELGVIRAGFRDLYILDAALKFADGTISEEKLQRLSVQDAKEMLCSIHGVGSKVADCILLFGLGRQEAFPVDVWIKRILEQYYFNGQEQPRRKLERFAADRFGDLGGIAQQYLFYYEREKKLQG